MERFKENLESRKEQNIISSVLMICFFVMIVALWAGLSDSRYTTTQVQNVENISINDVK